MKKNNANVMKTALALLLCLLGAVVIWVAVKYSMLTQPEAALMRLADCAMRS